MLRRSVHAVWSSTSSSTSQPCHFRRLLSTSATTPPAAWTRLVRYVNAEGRVAYGEPVHAHTVVGEHEHVHGEEPLRVHPVSFSHPLGMLAISSSDDDGTLVHRDRVDTVQRLLAPLMPPHVYGIGLNYRKHALETGLPIPRHPIVFSKPTSSVCAHGADIRVPLCCQGDAHAVKGSGGESSDISMESTMSEEEPVMEVDYEAELAVIIGCRVMPTTSSKSGSGTAASVAYCKDVSPKEALDFVVGYTGANDVTARRWQGAKRGGGQWDYAKSFDTFCPLGPAIVRGTCTSTDSGMDAGSAPHFPIACRLQRNHLKKDGVQTMQQSSTADLIFPIAHLISFLSQGRTLLPGTVILTGTPEGVGFARRPPVFLGHGDVVEVEVGGGIGVLRNRVWFEGRRA